MNEIDESRDNRLGRLTTGDRVLLGLFIPPIAGILASLIWILHRVEASSLTGQVLKWVLFEFLFLCFLFSTLLFVWVVARPRWIENLLAAVRDRLVKWLVVFLAVGFVGGAIVRILLWLAGGK
jgi:hypothetical protein